MLNYDIEPTNFNSILIFNNDVLENFTKSQIDSNIGRKKQSSRMRVKSPIKRDLSDFLDDQDDQNDKENDNKKQKVDQIIIEEVFSDEEEEYSDEEEEEENSEGEDLALTEISDQNEPEEISTKEDKKFIAKVAEEISLLDEIESPDSDVEFIGEVKLVQKKVSKISLSPPSAITMGEKETIKSLYDRRQVVITRIQKLKSIQKTHGLEKNQQVELEDHREELSIILGAISNLEEKQILQRLELSSSGISCY